MGTTSFDTGWSTAHPPRWQASAGQGIRWWQIGGAVLGTAVLLDAVTGPWVRVLVIASGGASVETYRRSLGDLDGTWVPVLLVAAPVLCLVGVVGALGPRRFRPVLGAAGVAASVVVAATLVAAWFDVEDALRATVADAAAVELRTAVTAGWSLSSTPIEGGALGVAVLALVAASARRPGAGPANTAAVGGAAAVATLAVPWARAWVAGEDAVVRAEYF